MNQHTVIASAILAVAIVGAAWLLKPIPPQQQPQQQQQQCWRITSNAGDPNSVIIFDQCAGEGWWVLTSNGRTRFSRFFDANTREYEAERIRDSAQPVK